jgi:peptidyl-prolyl cis-trans isomerase SurA
MRLRLQLAVLLLALPAGAQVVDRMVAVVNKRVVLESELEQTTRVECLMQGKSLEKLTPADTAAVLERLIDRALLQQQILNGADLDPAPEEVAVQIKELRAQLPNGASDEGWKSLLTSYGLMQADVEDHFIVQSRIMRFVDLRFRSLVRVDKIAIRAYYEQRFLPQLRQRGAPDPPLAEVSDRIEKILVEQSIDEMMGRWLETLRAQAHIEKIALPGASVATGARP